MGAFDILRAQASLRPAPEVDVVSATETVEGTVELATRAEAAAGSDTVRAVTPDALDAALDARTPTWNAVADLPQDPGWDVAFYLTPLQALTKLVKVGVMAPAVGSSALGTYLFDVQKYSGSWTSMLTATIDLEDLTNEVWHTTATPKSDGTENVDVGDRIRVLAMSDNADLTGFDQGISFCLYFGPR